MDNSKIGNARQQDDNRIAVAHAFGLGDCYRELSMIFARGELSPTDYVPAQLAHYEGLAAGIKWPTDPEELTQARRDWVKCAIMGDKAANFLQFLIADGALQLWRIHEAREVAVTPVKLDSGNVKNGIYKSFERPEPDMQGAFLWVKRTDWALILSAIEAAPQPDATGDSAPAKARKKPGKAPDPDWPHAIAKVTQDCIAAGFRHPLIRGNKAAIQTMLLSYMANRDKHFCDDTARKHANSVIAALPDH